MDLPQPFLMFASDLPATAPVRFGVEAIVQRLLVEFPASAAAASVHG